MSDTEARDRLAQIIEEHYYDGRSGWISYEDRQEAEERMADAILAAGFRPPARTVTTVEELDALPDGTVVRDSEGATAGRVDWLWFYIDPYGPASLIALPTTVLYEPKEDE